MSQLVRSLPMQAAPSGSFDWGKQWYPMAIAADLDPGRPHALELLGQPLVGASAAATSCQSGTDDTSCTPCMLPRSSTVIAEPHRKVQAITDAPGQLNCCALAAAGCVERWGGRVAGI